MTPPRLRIANMRSRLAGPFDLDLAAGECIAITGASGSGKSLFLRQIADLDPGEGEVFLDGTARSATPAPGWRKQVAYVAAESGWWLDMVAPHFPDLPAARAMAPALGLKPELFGGHVLRLSTGEKQRLALLRTLLPNPPVLLLDEPTGALDEASQAMVETILAARLAAGRSILLVTHDPGQALRLGQRHFAMVAGRLVAP